MIILENYDPKCPICGWNLGEDIYYQIKDNKIYTCNYSIKENKPIPVFDDIKVYPIFLEKEDYWEETHYCLLCNQEYIYYAPKIKEIGEETNDN